MTGNVLERCYDDFLSLPEMGRKGALPTELAALFYTYFFDQALCRIHWRVLGFLAAWEAIGLGLCTVRRAHSHGP